MNFDLCEALEAHIQAMKKKIWFELNFSCKNCAGGTWPNVSIACDWIIFTEVSPEKLKILNKNRRKYRIYKLTVQLPWSLSNEWANVETNDEELIPFFSFCFKMSAGMHLGIEESWEHNQSIRHKSMLGLKTSSTNKVRKRTTNEAEK